MSIKKKYIYIYITWVTGRRGSVTSCDFTRYIYSTLYSFSYMSTVLVYTSISTKYYNSINKVPRMLSAIIVHLKNLTRKMLSGTPSYSLLYMYICFTNEIFPTAQKKKKK